MNGLVKECCPYRNNTLGNTSVYCNVGKGNIQHCDVIRSRQEVGNR